MWIWWPYKVLTLKLEYSTDRFLQIMIFSSEFFIGLYKYETMTAMDIDEFRITI
jgi:hypothetical protein